MPATRYKHLATFSGPASRLSSDGHYCIESSQFCEGEIIMICNEQLRKLRSENLTKLPEVTQLRASSQVVWVHTQTHFVPNHPLGLPSGCSAVLVFCPPKPEVKVKCLGFLPPWYSCHAHSLQVKSPWAIAVLGNHSHSGNQGISQTQQQFKVCWHSAEKTNLPG